MLAVCCPVYGASFNCAWAITAQEKAICASPELSAADERMAQAYHAILESIPPKLVAEVREGQRQWVRSIAITCPARESAPSGLLEGCLKEDYRKRTNVLQNSIAHQGGVQFVWRSVTLTAPDDSEAAKNDRERGMLSESGILNASWPQLSVDTPEWWAWNKAIEDSAREMASQGNTQSDGKWSQEWAQDMDTDVTVSVALLGPSLVTATLNNEWYDHGAAHPNLDFRQFNWLLKEKRELRPEDVFRPASGWDKYLAERCLKTLKAQFGESYPDQEWTPGYVESVLAKMVTQTST
jgi:uncharacterized protein